MLDTLIDLDKSLLLYCNGSHLSWLDTFFWFISARLSNLWVILPLLLLLFYKCSWKEALLVVAGIVLTVLLCDQFASSVCKPLFHRPRPTHDEEIGSLVTLVNNYRGDYLNNVIMLSESNQQILNIVTTVVGYLLGFFSVNFIDNFRSKHGKFRPLALVTCIPYAIFGFFMFFTPFDANSAGGMIWIISVVLIYNLIGTFSGAENNVAIVMTPIEKERNSLFATNSFFTSIFSQTSLVLILGLGIARSQGVFDKNTMYFIALAILGVIYVVGTINAMLKTKERLVYTKEKASIFAGMRDVLKNKNFWWLTISHQIRNFRSIGTGFGIYIAGCLLGSTDNYIWVGLPTGIGTFVGMLIVQDQVHLARKAGLDQRAARTLVARRDGIDAGNIRMRAQQLQGGVVGALVVIVVGHARD